MESASCAVCTEKIEMFGLGQCDHKEVCAMCVYKMRVKQGQISCAICKANNEAVIITDDWKKNFEDYDLDTCIEHSQGSLYLPTDAQKHKFEMIISSRCPFPECADSIRPFREPLQYKKHLKERHQRYLW
jgi:hypothetical protein